MSASPSTPALARLLQQSASPSDTTTTVTPAPSTRLLTPKTNPIPLLSSLSSQLYAKLHTFLIPLYIYMRSDALVRDPYGTLLFDVLPVTILQAGFCAACLPHYGAWASEVGGAEAKAGVGTGAGAGGGSGAGVVAVTGAGGKGHAGSLRKRGPAVGGAGVVGGGKPGGVRRREDGYVSGGSWRSRLMPTTLTLILTTLLPPIPLALLATVLGAPLSPNASDLIPLTLLLSLHVSLLAFTPLFYAHGISGTVWHEISAAWLPFDSAGVWAGSVGCFVGGWVGAVPMALDWDREWQKWPCTVLWGAVVGWSVGRMLTGLLRVGVGLRISLE